MCLMQTDFPVPEGPRIIEILPSGMPMFRPRRILLRPKALWTSMNSTASGAPEGRWAPVCQRYSSSSSRPGGGASRVTAARTGSVASPSAPLSTGLGVARGGLALARGKV